MSAAPKSDKIRFIGSERCPICGGADDDPRGNGSRCHGWRKPGWAYCSREDRGGGADYSPEWRTYAHRLQGPCKCGVEHSPADVRPANAKWAGRAPRGRFDRAYVYRDAGGSPLFRVVRTRDPKGFYQERWQPDANEFRGGLKGMTPVLYHLPELLAADPAATVYVVEGEKDVENLEALGLVATSNPMGAEKWRDHYSDALRGRRCVLIQDNDDPGRNHVQKVARSLRGKAAEVRILELPGLAEHGDVSDWLADGGTVDRLRELAEAAAPPPPPQAEAGDPPTVELTTDIEAVNNQVLDALSRDPRVYQSNFALVTILDSGEPARGVDYKGPPPPQVRPVPAPVLREWIASCVRLAKAKKRDDVYELVPALPPDWCVSAIHARGVYPGFRPLDGVILAPTIRRDGSILDQPGYDPTTRLYYRPTIAFAPVPSTPTRAQAEAARDALLDLVVDFPFRGDADRALWLAGLLTVLAKAAFEGPAPLIGFDGNCPGAGKTMLADLISILALGAPAPAMAYPGGAHGNEEMDKRVLSLAIAGDRMTLLDNVEEPLGGEALCAAITKTHWKGRPLGRSEITSLPLNVVWFASGNNLAIRGDMLRRVLFARIETTSPNPEERTGFKHPNLIAHVTENRGRLVAAALTILRAWHVAGRPSVVKSLGSFEGWSHAVADPVAWITGVDPTEVRKFTKEDDQDSTLRMSLVKGWAQLPNSERGVTIAEAYRLLKAIGHDERFPILRSALMELSSDGDLPKPKSLSAHLRAIKGRTIGTLRLMGKNDRTDTMAWRVEPVQASPGNQTLHLNQ